MPLILDTVEYLRRAGQDRIAVTLDLRTDHGIASLGDTLAVLRTAGWNVRFLMLDAKTDTLVKRFSETRGGIPSPASRAR